MTQEILSNEEINALRYDLKAYELVTNTIRVQKTRLNNMLPEADPKKDPYLGGDDTGGKGLEYLKGVCLRRLERHARKLQIWNEWLKFVPGVGPMMACKLALHYYWRFPAVCEHCGDYLVHENEVEGTGPLKCQGCGEKPTDLLKVKAERRDWPTVSKWWVYCGQEVRDGKLVRRRAGERCNWNTDLKNLCFHIAECIQKQRVGHRYKDFINERKRKRLRTHPDISAGHRNNMARAEMVKLLLSHFWHVARHLEGLTTAGPYSEVILGHTNIIPPYYWDPASDIEEAA